MSTFKVIHVTDTHFGLQTFGTELSNGLNSRTLDAFQAFDSVIAYAKAHAVKLIVHSGDLFNSKNVSNNVINAFYQRVKQISDAGIDFYILQGNHDASANLANKNALDALSVFNLPHIHVTRGNNDLVDLGYAQLYAPSYWDNTEILQQKINQAADKINWNQPAFLVVHLQVEFANFPGSFKEDLPFTPLSILTNHPWSAVLMGHIHKYQKLNENPPVFYGGSLVRTSFSEEFDDKAFSVLTIKKNQLVDIHREPVTCLRMLTLRGTMVELHASLDRAKSEYFLNTIVRVIVDETNEVIEEKWLKDKFKLAFKLSLSKESKKIDDVKRVEGEKIRNIDDALVAFFVDQPDKDDLLALMEELKEIDENKLER